MALFLKQDENRTELQNKIVAELQEKARQQKNEIVDGVEDSAYLQNFKKSYGAQWLVVVVVLVIAGLIIWGLSTVLSKK